MSLMKQIDATTMLAAIAQKVRLEVLIALARSSTNGAASSDIADMVGVPRNLMSAHLAVLNKAGLVASQRTGRIVTYTIRTEAILALAEFVSSLASCDPSVDEAN